MSFRNPTEQLPPGAVDTSAYDQGELRFLSPVKRADGTGVAELDLVSGDAFFSSSAQLSAETAWLYGAYTAKVSTNDPAGRIVFTAPRPPSGALVPGVPMVMHGGAIRNTGTGWSFISDGSHSPKGFGAITAYTDRLEIAYQRPVGKVTTFTVTTDETFAAQGLRVGASVGLSTVVLKFYREPVNYIADYVSWDGTKWVSTNGVFTGFSYSGGVLTLTHESMGTTGQQAILPAFRGSCGVAAGGYGDTTSQIVFYTGAFGSLVAAGAPAAASHKAYVLRTGQRQAAPTVDPATIVATFGNLWLEALHEDTP